MLWDSPERPEEAPQQVKGQYIKGAHDYRIDPLILNSSQTQTAQKRVLGIKMGKDASSTHEKSILPVSLENEGDQIVQYGERLNYTALHSNTRGKGGLIAKNILLDGETYESIVEFSKSKATVSTPLQETVKAAAQGDLGKAAEEFAKTDPLIGALNQAHHAKTDQEKRDGAFAVAEQSWETAVSVAEAHQEGASVSDFMKDRFSPLNKASLNVNKQHTYSKQKVTKEYGSNIWYRDGVDVVADNYLQKKGSKLRSAKPIHTWVSDVFMLENGKVTESHLVKSKSKGVSVNLLKGSLEGGSAEKNRSSHDSTHCFNAEFTSEDEVIMHIKPKEFILRGADFGGKKKTVLNAKKLTTRVPLSSIKEKNKSIGGSLSTASASGHHSEERYEKQWVENPNRILGEDLEINAEEGSTEGTIFEGTERRRLNIKNWTETPVEEFETKEGKSFHAAGGKSLLAARGGVSLTNERTRGLMHSVLLPSKDAQDGEVPDSVKRDLSQLHETTSEEKSKHRFMFIIPNMDKISKDMSLFQEGIQDIKGGSPEETHPYYEGLEEMVQAMEEEGVPVEERQALINEFAPQLAEAVMWEPGREEESPAEKTGKEGEGDKEKETVSPLKWEEFMGHKSTPSEASIMFSPVETPQEETYRELQEIGSAFIRENFPHLTDWRMPGERSSEPKETRPWLNKGLDLLDVAADSLNDLEKLSHRAEELRCNSHPFSQKACRVEKEWKEKAGHVWDDLTTGSLEDLTYAAAFGGQGRRKEVRGLGEKERDYYGNSRWGRDIAAELKKNEEKILKWLDGKGSEIVDSLPEDRQEKTLESLKTVGKGALKGAELASGLGVGASLITGRLKKIVLLNYEKKAVASQGKKLSILRDSNNRVKAVKYTQRHHILHQKLGNHELFSKAGMDVEHALNRMILPTKKGAGLSTTKRSIHEGRHLKKVERYLERKMDDAAREGFQNNWDQTQYKKALKRIIREERALLKTGERKLNKNHRPWAKDD
jgi:hypothetical protein